MARPHPSNRDREKPGRAQPPRPTTIPVARYDAPGDPPISVASYLTLQQPFRLDRALAHQLERRDVNPKEAFTIHDGSGDFFRASLKELTADGGLAVPYERMMRSPEPTVEITLACAVLARQRMIFIMQKATELGVMRIVPLLSDHSVPADGLEHERANAWPAQVIRAAKQCRRASLPAVLPPTPLNQFITTDAVTNADVCIVMDDRTDPAKPLPAPPRKIVLFVGPEGGFSDAERATLTHIARPWFLGGRILRAETAIIVGLTVVHTTWGDFAAGDFPASSPAGK